MMLRILSNHPHVYGLNELHFFEKLWSSADRDKVIHRQAAEQLAAKLLFVQRDGYIGKTNADRYLTDAARIIDRLGEGPYFAHDVFAAMMNFETGRHGRKIPCEKTPQNVFYLKEIFDLFPNARVINMIRDPRAVMLSQKRKWRRRKMGATFITPWEVMRLRINYHPITLSRLWNAAIGAALPYRDDERVLHLHFEDMLGSPEAAARKICEHLQIPFLPEILDIPQASSSNRADSSQTGIDQRRAGNWKKGGLRAAEIYWCQRISGEKMAQTGYAIEPTEAGWLARTAYAVSFPFKLALALLINLNRMKSIGETLRKRLRPA
jgi:hypothetical protein